jgi:hypothetical protein
MKEIYNTPYTKGPINGPFDHLINIKSLIRNQKSEVKTSLCIKPNEWIFPRILINKSYHGRSYK